MEHNIHMHTHMIIDAEIELKSLQNLPALVVSVETVSARSEVDVEP
jgi:hypothetical protein